MAKVLIRYGIHPREYGNLAAESLSRDYSKSHGVVFKEYPYKRTFHHMLFSMLNKNPKLLSAPEEERRQIKLRLASRENNYRSKLNSTARERGFIPVEVHTYGGGTPIVMYNEDFAAAGKKLAAHLKKKFGVVQESSCNDSNSCITIELPGTSDRDLPATKVFSEFLRPYVSASSPAALQSGDQIVQSKRILLEIINFLKEYKGK